MSWDPFQREVLAELGHVLYRQAGVSIASDAEAVRVGSPGFDSPDFASPGLDSPDVDAPSMNHAMLAVVARAAGMNAEALQARIDDTQLIASLHGNASAKRALWPRLRALRRQQY